MRERTSGPGISILGSIGVAIYRVEVAGRLPASIPSFDTAKEAIMAA